MSTADIAGGVAAIQERIGAACARSGRKADEVRLMAVSKFHSRDAVEAAWNAGVRLFGESRVREAAEKFEDIKEDRPGMELHMIGTLQRNKAKAAVSLFDCVQSVDRDELIAELGKLAASRQKPGFLQGQKPLGILLELNAGEESKSGYADEDDLFRGAEQVLSWPNLVLRGLMIMAPFTTDTALIRRAFRSLGDVQRKLETRFPEADWSCLSMGMSGDFEIAIEEGSTLVRVGTAIFGERQTGGLLTGGSLP
ncbi:YggS family pyridoxal phosphate enzyme [Spirochaetia bacterium]|nr:YggS family pyridoxal phosphate enzyme [Spirochaetia bacterium]